MNFNFNINRIRVGAGPGQRNASPMDVICITRGNRGRERIIARCVGPNGRLLGASRCSYFFQIAWRSPSYLGGSPIVRSPLRGAISRNISTMYSDGVIPAMSLPSTEIDCKPIIIGLGSPTEMSPPGGKSGVKKIGEPLFPATRFTESHHTRIGTVTESLVHLEAAISSGMPPIFPNLKIG